MGQGIDGQFVIGIIGGGQLARMMHAASIGLGVQVRLLAEGPDASAAQVVHDVMVGDYTDAATVTRFARTCDVITFDHEHVPTEILTDLVAAGIAVRPGPAALVHAQDKAVMRERLAALGAPCPTNEVVSDATELAAFGDRTGWPVIAKTSRGGYDGKGVWKIDGPDQVGCRSPGSVRGSGSWPRSTSTSPASSAPWSCARRRAGVAYPISETVQRDGVCVETTTPAPGLSAEKAIQAQQLALTIARELEVVGVLAVELMERRTGELVVNELAMRPHNTGHWSIDGAHTSQFENHLRAVLDLPLGDPSTRVARGR